MDTIPSEIVEKMLECVESSSTLMACRSVSRRWNGLCRDAFRRRHRPIHFSSEAQLTAFLAFCLESQFDEADFPFAKFYFQLEKLSSNSLQTFRQFFGPCLRECSLELRLKRRVPRLFLLEDGARLLASAQLLTRLSLNIACPLTEEESVAFVRLLPPSFPQLTSLQLNRDFVCTSNQNRSSVARLFIFRTLKALAPNLQQLLLLPWDSTDMAHVAPLLALAQGIPSVVLKNVAMSTNVQSESEWAALATAEYKLTHLHLRLTRSAQESDEPSSFPRAFCTWLQHHAPTLTSLTLLAEEMRQAVRLPRLGALRVLEVGVGAYSDVDVCPPFSPFLPAHLPRLKSLTLKFYSEEWGLFSGAFDTVQRLTLEGYQDAVVTEPWHLIFPALSTLEVICFKAEQLAFLTQLRHLRRLRVWLSDALCGDDDHCTWRVLTGGGASVDHDTASSHGLGGLARLETLELRGCGEESVGGIVAMTKNGSLRPLASLTISPAFGNEISEEDSAALRAVHRDVNLSRPLKHCEHFR